MLASLFVNDTKCWRYIRLLMMADIKRVVLKGRRGLGAEPPVEMVLQHHKKGDLLMQVSFFVVLGRIELPTHGFSVHCSTI